jgi:hypothetical protein
VVTALGDPTPRAGTGVELAGRHLGGEGDLLGVSEGLPGQRRAVDSRLRDGDFGSTTSTPRASVALSTYKPTGTVAGFYGPRVVVHLHQLAGRFVTAELRRPPLVLDRLGPE